VLSAVFFILFPFCQHQTRFWGNFFLNTENLGHKLAVSVQPFVVVVDREALPGVSSFLSGLAAAAVAAVAACRYILRYLISLATSP
jgi:hypothetical protein